MLGDYRTACAVNAAIGTGGTRFREALAADDAAGVIEADRSATLAVIESRPAALARVALAALVADRATAAVAEAVAEHTGELRAELVDRLEQAVREELALIDNARSIRELERMDEMHLPGWATTRALQFWLDHPDRWWHAPQRWHVAFDPRVHSALWTVRTGRLADEWPRVNSWLTGIAWSGAEGSTVNGRASVRAALLGVTIPGHLPSEFGQRISPMTVELPNTRRVIPVLHGDRDQILGRVSGAAWTTDGGLALDITMTSTATARTFYAEQLADPRWPMYAHPLTAASPAGSYRRLSQLVAVKLWPVESWPSATVRVIRPPEFPIVIDRRGRIDSSRR